jgi:FkbM family methyltransferase
MTNYTHYYKTLHVDGHVPVPHTKYLEGMHSILGISPKVIYDVGSAILHWTKDAKRIWPDAKIIAFEAVREVEQFYTEFPIDYAIGVFSDVDEKSVTFYDHPTCLGGNSYYKENKKYSAAAETIYGSDHEFIRKTSTIDSVVKMRNFPVPDLLKIDVQGAELDILAGMPETLKSVKHLIVELQHVEYNIGAALLDKSIPAIEKLGFELVPTNLIFPEDKNAYFSGNGPDADYHFIRKGLINV